MKQFLYLTLLITLLCGVSYGEPLKVMILDGQNNHDWKTTTPVLKELLLETGLFTVDVATSPPEGKSQEDFNPDFAKYDVVVLNYAGDNWNPNTRAAFLEYVNNGGGVVVVHAADNAFGDWPEYNEIIGFGGWGGRTKASGPYVYLKDGQLVHDYESDGPAGAHEGYDEFIVDNELPEHPILKGMPKSWYQQDELYNYMRGPGKNMTVLATAYSGKPKDKGGSGRHEPMLVTITYGKGNIFHTALGHDVRSLRCKGFALTFTRGAEWVATGKVTIPAPEDIPHPMAPHEAVAAITEEDSYIPLNQLLTEVGNLMDKPEELAALEGKLIGYLEDPDTSFLGVQAICNALGVGGSSLAVPVLAKLLARDARCASAALLALERIPGPEATETLLKELQENHDFNQAGIINSLGNRRDAAAVPALTALAQSGNAAAVNALGKIGNEAALSVLSALTATPDVITALLLCAHRLVKEGKTVPVQPVFVTLLDDASLKKHQLTAALDGLLKTDPETGMQHVWSLLQDEERSAVALNVLGGVPGNEKIAQDILAHFDNLNAATQTLLVAILGNMAQPVVLPKVLSLAQSQGDGQRKEAAIIALGQIPGNESSLSFLCEEACRPDSPLQKQAHQALVTTPGVEAEHILVQSIAGTKGEARIEYIKAARDRYLEVACPALLDAARDADESVQNAAFAALQTLAGPNEY